MKIETAHGTIEVLEKLKNKMGKIKCFCGNIKISNIYKLRTGAHKSCGCLGPKFVDYTGKQIGNLFVVGKEGSKENCWKCICECGKTKFVVAKVLRNGGHQDCVCKGRETFYKNKLYIAWTNYRIKNILSEDFMVFNDFKYYVENELKIPNDNYIISRINKLEKFSKTNIKIQILSHIKTMCDMEYKFCVTCQRYVQNSKQFYMNNGKNTCNNCLLKKKLKYKFNLEYSEYLELLKNSNRQCEICKKHLKFGGKYRTGVIDHCHNKNKVRGILCRQCNNALGLFKDDINTLKNTIEYLNRGETKYQYTQTSENNPIIDTTCPITGNKKNLVCDHNHKTGFIRGNICNYKNLAIGLLKDSVQNLENSINYLEKSI